MIPSRLEVMRHLDKYVAEHLPKLLRDPEVNWQPSDFAPDLRTDEGFEELRALREEAVALPDGVLVGLVGDMVTEEALPTYASWISTLEGVGALGEPRTAWGAWNRGWCAEENRHGDVLNRYLYLSGRVNMREVEVTVQHLIRDGGEILSENDPYRTFVYTSFQEIATRISHLNVGRLAQAVGAERLFALSKRVAGDEERHARAYKTFVSWILEADPNEMVLAFCDMMKKKITMPAMYMRERGKAIGETFRHFEVAAERAGIYTAQDYVGIVEHLVEEWRVGALTGLKAEAAKAQDYLCGLAGRYRKIIERRRKPASEETYSFAWLAPSALAEPT